MGLVDDVVPLLQRRGLFRSADAGSTFRDHLREHRGQIFDLDVVGRPDSLTVLAAPAAETKHLSIRELIIEVTHRLRSGRPIASKMRFV